MLPVPGFTDLLQPTTACPSRPSMGDNKMYSPAGSMNGVVSSDIVRASILVGMAKRPSTKRET
ncbi:hypothetical protein ACFLSZ_02270 [Candidatus Bipolaricaulota bacterium]